MAQWSMTMAARPDSVSSPAVSVIPATLANSLLRQRTHAAAARPSVTPVNAPVAATAAPLSQALMPMVASQLRVRVVRAMQVERAMRAVLPLPAG
jgi:hypothetical protein